MTFAEADVAYRANANYFTANNATTTANFIEACTVLIAQPSGLSTDGRSISYDLGVLQKQLESAQSLYNAQAGGRANGRSRVNRIDFKEPQGVD